MKRRTLTTGTENPLARRHNFLLNKAVVGRNPVSSLVGNIRAQTLE